MRLSDFKPLAIPSDSTVENAASQLDARRIPDACRAQLTEEKFGCPKRAGAVRAAFMRMPKNYTEAEAAAALDDFNRGAAHTPCRFGTPEEALLYTATNVPPLRFVALGKRHNGETLFCKNDVFGISNQSDWSEFCEVFIVTR